jgi:hypothetical protein
MKWPAKSLFAITRRQNKALEIIGFFVAGEKK